MLSSNSLARR
jgi:hypothetical protein